MKKLTPICLIVFSLLFIQYISYADKELDGYEHNTYYYSKNVHSALESSKKTNKNNEEVLVKMGVGKLSAGAVRLSATKLNITKGKTSTLKLYGTSIKAVATSNPKVAVIYKNGVVKAISKGTCFVAVKGNNNQIYKCIINVESPYLNAKKIKIAVSESFDINLNGTKKTKTFTVKNSSIASVKSTGVVTGNKVGKTRVYCKSDGKYYACDVEVTLKVKSLKNKKVSIIGDSISTMDMYIPGDYKTFYPYKDVWELKDTWWKMVIDATGMKLLKNCSWSTSKVTGDSTSLTSGYVATSYKRIADLSSKGVKPDIIIVYIGTNDFGKGAPLGEWIYDRYDLVDKSYVYNFDEAYALMLKKIKDTYPNAEVFCCTLCPMAAFGVLPYTYINKKGTSLDEYNYAIRNIARIYGYKVFDLYSCGFGTDNFDKYMADGKAHPNIAGMKVIKNKILKELDKYYK